MPKTKVDGTMLGSSLTLESSREMYVRLGGQYPDLPITVFVTDWCSVCKAVENDFTSGGIKYARADIEKSREALLYYQIVTKRQTSSVPVVVVGDKVFMGYSPRGVAKAILSFGQQRVGSI